MFTATLNHIKMLKVLHSGPTTTYSTIRNSTQGMSKVEKDWVAEEARDTNSKHLPNTSSQMFAAKADVYLC